MDKKQKIKKIRELVQQRIKLSQELGDLKIYKTKLEKVKKEYAGKI